MNIPEYLLAKLAEECAEVAQRAVKAMCFGTEEVQPEQKLSNAARINLELADLLAIVDELRDRNVLPYLPAAELIRLKNEKKHKLDRYMAYSVEQGTLVE